MTSKEFCTQEVWEVFECSRQGLILFNPPAHQLPAYHSATTYPWLSTYQIEVWNSFPVWKPSLRGNQWWISFGALCFKQVHTRNLINVFLLNEWTLLTDNCFTKRDFQCRKPLQGLWEQNGKCRGEGVCMLTQLESSSQKVHRICQGALGMMPWFPEKEL